MGGALVANKHLIPVVWDMDPGDLPGWTNQIHALDLRHHTPAQMQSRIQELAKQLKAKKDKGFLVGAASLTGFFWLMSRSE